jgi:hypothetical protein
VAGRIIAPAVGAELTKNDRRAVSKAMLGWTVKSVANAFIWKTLVQLALSGLRDDDDEEKWNLHKAMFGNSMGRQWDIKLPWKDQDGRDQYLIMNIFKEAKNFQQATGMGSKPDWQEPQNLIDNLADYLWMKMSFLPKGVFALGGEITGLGGLGGDPHPARTLLRDSFIPEPARGNNVAATTALAQSVGLGIRSEQHRPLRDEYQFKKNRMLLNKEEKLKQEARWNLRQQPTLAKVEEYYRANRDKISRETYLNEVQSRTRAEYYQRKTSGTAIRKARISEERRRAGASA